mmetsp:Transcript_9384/g.36624  ORF Transcript_9384/g.36624 Transcript_9384/m.36624 type:complete len:415 (-) Transcript_9384:104-1348(-)
MATTKTRRRHAGATRRTPGVRGGAPGGIGVQAGAGVATAACPAAWSSPRAMTMTMTRVARLEARRAGAPTATVAVPQALPQTGLLRASLAQGRTPRQAPRAPCTSGRRAAGGLALRLRCPLRRATPSSAPSCAAPLPPSTPARPARRRPPSQRPRALQGHPLLQAPRAPPRAQPAATTPPTGRLQTCGRPSLRRFQASLPWRRTASRCPVRPASLAPPSVSARPVGARAAATRASAPLPACCRAPGRRSPGPVVGLWSQRRGRRLCRSLPAQTWKDSHRCAKRTTPEAPPSLLLRAPRKRQRPAEPTRQSRSSCTGQSWRMRAWAPSSALKPVAQWAGQRRPSRSPPQPRACAMAPRRATGHRRFATAATLRGLRPLRGMCSCVARRALRGRGPSRLPSSAGPACSEASFALLL